MSIRCERGSAKTLLLLCFLKYHVFAEFFAVFLELYFLRDKLLVLARPIHLPRGGVFEHDELILRHSAETIPNGL